jgi:hypothetical protein
MLISSFPKYIFWQYKADADLPKMVVLENVLLYGDLEDLLNISKQFTSQEISQVRKKIEAGNRWKKRTFFIKMILQ